LPRALSPGEVDSLLGALRTRRDRAMVLAMLLGGLRRCKVRGLRLGDVSVGERRVHITCAKVGRERIVPVSGRFFGALGEYLELERPAETTTEACFIVLKGPRRGLPLSPSGLDEVLDGARARRATSSSAPPTCRSE
jgi:integrase